ncbi:RNA polymerase sigma factor [Caenimonas aquaedulcis]|uniref:RNA polymerase sigma factor n=1 Tax=Caenimonas aquaedulcis TaxID=2793270 RepID=A0A931H8K7_9BURK|nr:RNA polymerase sigma factor [Caenimonas aquaedulcis]MBG9390538.1 RNA polymerase sigma factor [Caenimonas aquaedulcis]
MTNDTNGQARAGGTPPWELQNHELRSLMLQCRNGDMRAFEKLYALTARWMLARVRRIVDDGQAEDVLAEVYIQIWNSLDSYDESRSPPAAWMAMIARSRALDHLRRERRHRCDADAESSEPALLLCEDSPERLLSQAQDAQLVHLSLATLEAQERLVLGLSYFHDYTQSQISDLIGMPLGSVKTLAQRGRKKIRKFLAGLCAAHPAPLAANAAAAVPEART